MDRREIEKILPHRAPMLLLDGAEVQAEEAVGYYDVRGDEFFLRGHFPGDPIVPGVILCEILAQSACVLLEGRMEQGQIPVYTGLDKVRFHSPVRPGDRIETRCRIVRVKPPFYFAEGSCAVGGKTCMIAAFSFAVTEG
ncbi:MAG: 3-hydroxyacyl-ACP dehydratase FabZ family protein [Butyricicoccaceae bacterium]